MPTMGFGHSLDSLASVHGNTMLTMLFDANEREKANVRHRSPRDEMRRTGTTFANLKDRWRGLGAR